ncbi:MAG: putative UDP-glucose epimerase YtcB [Ardenticatenaceae bacterium]|nr:MAG: putative UDP-glucose epimerase YtcB [Ardenticatenaceae bacterium]
MKILITGIAGFIGSNLAEHLLSLGHEVVGIDSFTDYYDPALKKLNAADITAKGAIIYNKDLATDDLTEPLDNVEMIYHLAGQPGISATTSFEKYLHNNVVATHKLINAAASLPTLKCFVNTATSSVYGAHATDSEGVMPKPTSYYGVTKLTAEQLVMARQREDGFPACSIRIFSIYGPRERPDKLFPRVIKSILLNKPFTLFAGSEHHSRSFTFVEDAIGGYVAVLNNYQAAIGEIFNIGSETEFSTGEAIEIIEGVLGKKAMKKIGPKRPGDQLRTCANISKAKRMLGYSPKTKLEEGLSIEAAWFQEKIMTEAVI